MGCGGSRLDHGNGMVLPPRLRPLILLRLEEFKMHRHTRPLIKDSSSTTSKYEENQQGREDEKPKEEVCEENEQKHLEVVKDRNVKDLKIKEESEFEDALTDAYNDDHDNDKEDEDGRMFGHDDDEAFPGSPTFRVYFKDDGRDTHNDLGKVKNNAFKSTNSSDDDTVSSKDSSDHNKNVKRGRLKKKSFRKVLPKGGQAAVKNLLSVKLCYHPSPSAHHPHQHHSHLLTGKTAA